MALELTPAQRGLLTVLRRSDGQRVTLLVAGDEYTGLATTDESTGLITVQADDGATWYLCLDDVAGIGIDLPDDA